MTKFVHLRVYSDYSLGSGAIRIKDLVKECVKQRLPALALTDKNNLFACLEFSSESLKAGIQPIAGIDVTVCYGKEVYGNLLLLAHNDIGFANLLKIASAVYLKRANTATLSISFIELIDHSDGLIIIAANPIDSIEKKLFVSNTTNIFNFLDELHKAIKSRLYIELIRKNNESLEDSKFEKTILDYAYSNNIPLVATNYVSFLNPSFYEAQDTLSCILNGRYILEDDRPKLSQDFYFKNAKEMELLFEDVPEALTNTVKIAKSCLVYAKSRAPLLPNFSTDQSIPENELIRINALKGLRKRIGDCSVEDEKMYFERLDFELSVINKMQYAGYFLIVADFIAWSKKQGIPVGPGRGSGAGSIVAWALGITDLDPIKFGLLFERFLNPDRISLPDFDIDFCQDRREEVIGYVKQKYGDKRVAQIITFGKLQARAVLRDVGRVLHMPYGLIDKICKMVPNNPANPVTLAEAIALDKELQKSRLIDPEINKLLTISLQLEGINRHVSTHAAGIVIADRPIVELVPLYLDHQTTAPHIQHSEIDVKAAMPAVQYSMKYAEEAGLIKFDFLGLRTLTVIAWTVKLLKNKGIDIDITKLKLNDPTTYSLLSKGATTGVFQFESAGMKEAIKRLKPDTIEDLIALGSLYRPGPMDNIPSYINRKHGLEKPQYLHPLMEQSLKETYGIIVYQEQVMEIARSLAGYTLGAADLLRRAMGKKIKSEMEAQRDIFVNGCTANNIDKSKAQEIFALIEKFASYGFNKSHAAAYAIISYQTAYLKANHIKEFIVASITSEIQDTDKINLFIQEAKKFDVLILLPNINKSQVMFAVDDLGSIRFGLAGMKNVGIAAITRIVEERKNGEFKSIYDFVERCGKGLINRRLLESLIYSGALDCLDDNRRKLLENVNVLLKYSQEYNLQKDSAQGGLFSFTDEDHDHKPNLGNVARWSTDEALKNEFNSFGYYLSSHPLEKYSIKLKKMGITESDKVELITNGKGVKINLAGVIISRKVKSSKRGKYAFLQLSDRSGLIEVSIFNEELLYKNDDILQIGCTIFAVAEARVDDAGLKIILESISPIEEAVKKVKTNLSILISNGDTINQVKELLTLDGKQLSLNLKLEEGQIVNFKSNKAFYISEENEIILRTLPNVEVFEY